VRDQTGNEIEYQIMMTQSKGMTALFDAVYLAATRSKNQSLKKKASFSFPMAAKITAAILSPS